MITIKNNKIFACLVSQKSRKVFTITRFQVSFLGAWLKEYFSVC